MRTREDSFEYQVKEMVRTYIENWGIKRSEKDIDEALWKNKDGFGEIALNKIWEYLGDIQDEIFKELKDDETVDFEEEEEEEEEEEGENE